MFGVAFTVVEVSDHTIRRLLIDLAGQRQARAFPLEQVRHPFLSGFQATCRSDRSKNILMIVTPCEFRAPWPTVDEIESISRDSGRLRKKRRVCLQSQRRSRYVLAVLLAGGLIWLGLVCWQVGRDRRALLEIKVEIAQARYGIAARRLTALLTQNPNADEAAYLLGVCEQRRGHAGAASEAWAAVAPGSEFASRAVQARMRLAQEMGHFAEAERLVNEAADDPRNDGSELRQCSYRFIAGSGSPRSRAARRGPLGTSEWQRSNWGGAGSLSTPAPHQSFGEAQLGREHSRLSRRCRETGPPR